MLLLVDTNVLLRLVEPEHPQHAMAVPASESLDVLGYVKLIVPQVIYEFCAVATRPVDVNGLGLTIVETNSKLEAILSTFRLLRDERKIYERWRQLIVKHDVKGKQVHDARLMAAMLRHNISHLMTFNASDFARFSQITVIDPRHAAAIGPAT